MDPGRLTENDMNTEIETPITADELLKEILEAKQETPADKDVPEAEEDLDKLSRKSPPKRGLCRRCGENKPINRLMLCYPCWVKTNLEERGWREGMPHPEGCDCTLSEHGRRSDGN